MTREDAKIFLYSVAGDLGFTDVENYTCKDGEKMREAIETLEQEPCNVPGTNVGDRMIDIRFYIPKNESIPTDLRLYVGENYIEYERTANGFLFKTLIDDEDEAMKVVQQIVDKMKSEHDESEHGVSWRTISLTVVPQEERYKIGTWVEWKYRVRDSY